MTKLSLYIIRHAKASHDDYFPGDIYRTLDPRGYEEAMKTAAKLNKELGKRPDLIITSPALRAYSTSLIFALDLNYDPAKIVLKPSMYEAFSNALIQVINETDDSYKCVLIFGHNPGFTEVINDLCGPVLSNLPTAGIAEINFKVQSWKDVAPGTGILKNKIFP